jgi:hypothetical protein
VSSDDETLTADEAIEKARLRQARLTARLEELPTYRYGVLDPGAWLSRSAWSSDAVAPLSFIAAPGAPPPRHDPCETAS